MLLLRAVHRPPGSMVRSACYGSSSGVKSPSRRLLVVGAKKPKLTCAMKRTTHFRMCAAFPFASPAHFFTRFGSEIRRGEFSI